MISGTTALNWPSDPDYPGRVERAIRIDVETWSANWPPHIHNRFTRKQVAPLIKQLRARIEKLKKDETTINGNK